MQILPLAAFYIRMSLRILLYQETFIKMDQICCPVCHRWALVWLHKGEICIHGSSMLAAPVCVFSLLQSLLTVTDLIRRRRNRLLWWRPICLSLRCLCVLKVHRSDSWCLDLSSLRILCHIFGRPVKKMIISTKVHVLLFLFFTFVFSPVCLSPVAVVRAATALPSLAKGQRSGGGGTRCGCLPGATGVSYLAPCGLPQPKCIHLRYVQLRAQIPRELWDWSQLFNDKSVLQTTRLTQVGEERCPVDNVNLWGVHRQPEECGVF